jgi:alpha-ketoglutarate-dependent taurine dioxygenase
VLNRHTCAVISSRPAPATNICPSPFSAIGPDEAEALIAALADHIIKPAFVYRHQWRPGDVLMWDNCMVQHRAIQDYDMPSAA